LIPDIISKIKIKIACFYSKFGERGSILLEVAIALAVLGLMGGFFISKIMVLNKAAREKITRNNIATVSLALASFVANNNRLPRPSLSNDGGECPESDSPLANAVGRIPFYTIGIAAKTTLDGSGKPLIYIVEPTLTANFQSIYGNGMSSCFCDGNSARNIFVDKAPALMWNPVAFVLDTADNQPTISDVVHVTVSANTHLVSRDMLLMMYLKSRPCRGETPTAPEISRNPPDPFDTI
jgi:type II secretory pathway pseudopilin PulG